MQSVKEQAISTISKLAENVTWRDLMYKLYVIQTVEQGFADYRNGDVVSHADIEKEFLTNETNLE